MVINHNIAALNTYRQLSANNTNGNKSLEKLSSGLRINKAGDDAAGLAISEKMRGQISGLDQASRNAQDGISLIQTAEGGLTESQSIIQRMRELAVQSANDTNTDSDRAQMQKEINQLSAEVTRISTDTEFNTKKLLNGAMGKTFSTTTNSFKASNVQITGTDITTGTYSLTLTAAGTDTYAINTNTAATGLTASNITAATGNKYGTYSLQISNFQTGVSADLTLTGPDGTVSTLSGQSLSGASTAIGGITFDFSGSNISSNGTIAFSLTDNGLKVDLGGAKSVTGPTVSAYAGETLNVGGFQFTKTVGSGANGDVNTMNVTDNSIKFQIGANQNQNTNLSVNNMSAAALGIDALDITTQSGANAAITTIDAANNAVSTERANLGAMQNRLEHTINNLGTTSENLTASESQIRDVDMAKEMTEYTKNNILSQAATAMLAQANQAPQQVLSLLK
jgi:flagellin